MHMAHMATPMPTHGIWHAVHSAAMHSLQGVLHPRMAALPAAACFDVLCRWTQCYAVANTCWFSTDPYNNMGPCQYLYSLGSVALFWQFFISMASVGTAPPLTGGNWVAHAPAQSITHVSMGAASVSRVGAAPRFQR